MYKYILLPGRSHIVTNFQINYLNDALMHHAATTIDNRTVDFSNDCSVIWAITSGNHANTRRNPIPGNRRLAMVELASQSLVNKSAAYLIPNMNPKPDFGHYVVEEIRVQSKGACDMNPNNTIIACSTPSIIKQYQSFGYSVIPVELTELDTEETSAPRPWDVIEAIIAAGADWESNDLVRSQLHPACLQYFKTYHLAEHICSIFEDPLTSGDGDITETREYESYRAAFEDNAYRKVEVFAPYVQPGRIVDVGCATGQTIKLLSEKADLFESDFYGIEAARPLYDICQQRLHNGVFGTANVYFYQRNIMLSEIFPENSVNTIITMALTHEIESYMGHQSLLDFLQRMYDMLAPGGVYINYDVVGPARKDTEVWVAFNKTDGNNPKDLYPASLKNDDTYLQNMSSEARFLRFCNDFRNVEHDNIKVRTDIIDGEKYFVMQYADLCEYLAKKDYTQSWFSEMHERFCFWNFNDWSTEIQKIGFTVHEASTPIQNPWLIQNRFAPAAKVYYKDDKDALTAMPYPETNIMLIAQKPL